MTVWICTPLKPGFTPRFAYARARSRPFWPVRLKNLVVRPWPGMYVPFRAYLGLCAQETWLYALGRVCTAPFVPVWVCTPLKPGFTPRFPCVRARSSPFWPVHLENLAVRAWASMFVPFGANFGL